MRKNMLFALIYTFHLDSILIKQSTKINNNNDDDADADNNTENDSQSFCSICCPDMDE